MIPQLFNSAVMSEFHKLAFEGINEGDQKNPDKYGPPPAKKPPATPPAKKPPATNPSTQKCASDLDFAALKLNEKIFYKAAADESKIIAQAKKDGQQNLKPVQDPNKAGNNYKQIQPGDPNRPKAPSIS
jgi:hypothetical protein